MKALLNHSWNISEQDAIQLQQQLALRVIHEDCGTPVEYVAGVDVAYSKHSGNLVAAVVILNAESLELVESATVEDTAAFPYIPGLFSFRELPPVIKAFEKIKTTPQLVVCDGQGFAHPRRFGLASHLGVLLDIPTIGCGKTRLIGDFTEPDLKRGSYSPLVDHGEEIGSVLRTQEGVKPIFVSVGHRISLATACEWILKLSPRYRLPETTRQADHLVKMVLGSN
ncbi:deoxyribonuclease V [Paenibacillus sp. VCA1]|uniref:deoxyribonuclease V n=1 Tax=Paenibacillus sp. VCA1 TaxID=3039148 RepID=UPI0028717A15|nr:deoxyribonuclease V [Paenibacillus sp. VCA1]MDR9856645.1 deoxyribonuclease V [Paenibacillus sp. VCA1]